MFEDSEVIVKKNISKFLVSINLNTVECGITEIISIVPSSKVFYFSTIFIYESKSEICLFQLVFF